MYRTLTLLSCLTFPIVAAADPGPIQACPTAEDRALADVAPANINAISLSSVAGTFVFQQLSQQSAQVMIGTLASHPDSAQRLVQLITPEQAKVLYDTSRYSSYFFSKQPDPTTMVSLFQDISQPQSNSLTQLPNFDSNFYTQLSTISTSQSQILFSALSSSIAANFSTVFNAGTAVQLKALQAPKALVPPSASTAVTPAVAQEPQIQASDLQKLTSAQADLLSKNLRSGQLTALLGQLRNDPALTKVLQQLTVDQAKTLLTSVVTDSTSVETVFAAGGATQNQARILLSLNQADAVGLFTAIKNQGGTDASELAKKATPEESAVIMNAFVPGLPNIEMGNATNPQAAALQMTTSVSTARAEFDATYATQAAYATMAAQQLAAIQKSFAQIENNQASAQEMVINGLAQFIETRSRAELQEIVIDDVLGSLCERSDDPVLKSLFPETCRVNTLRKKLTGLAIGNSYSRVVIALRSDIDHIPACVLYKMQNTKLAYQLQSIYQQNTSGVDLDRLLYSLASTGDLNRTGLVLNDSADDLCIYTPVSGGVNQGFNSSYCGVVVAIVSYAAAIQATRGLDIDHVDRTDLGEQTLVAHAYQAAFDNLADKNRLTALRKDIDTWLNADDSHVASAAALLFKFCALHRASAAQYNNLNKQDTQSRTVLANTLLAIGNTTLDQMYTAVDIVLPGTLQTKTKAEASLQVGMQLLTDIQGIYVAMEAQEYSVALTRAEPILSCFILSADSSLKASYCNQAPIAGANAEDCKQHDVGHQISCVLRDLEEVNGAMAALADAKSSDEFSATLDQLAAPVDSWKLRQQTNMFALTAYGGLALGNAIYYIPNYGTFHNDLYYSVFAPIGITYTEPFSGHDGSKGVFLSLLDLGNVIQQPVEVDFPGGRITGSVDGKLSQVFTPGLYGIVSPFQSLPITFYIGASYGPSNFREVIYNNGATNLASRRLTYTLGVAFDIVIFEKAIH